MAYDINGDLHDVVLTVKETTKGEEAKNHINHRKRTAFKYSLFIHFVLPEPWRQKLPKGREGPKGRPNESYYYLDSDDWRRKSYQDLLRLQAQVRSSNSDDQECGWSTILCRILQCAFVIIIIVLVVYFAVHMWQNSSGTQ